MNEHSLYQALCGGRLGVVNVNKVGFLLSDCSLPITGSGEETDGALRGHGPGLTAAGWMLCDH